MSVLAGTYPDISPVHRFVLNEMVQTERDYVKDLGVIVEVCYR